ncbi:hypothetical protein CLLU_32690 [Clostridium luticellarii]|jgi:tetratricopeptide (TPR) repeat protein|uniref:Uncharacterized protein n=1 Tax=Clostridium luticellarii TaxID=1691940 RepID=A0A2T0BAL7_9CLOT|nr:hypothetical protein CLLU_32690 [Clostridium luticellarii]
MDNNYEEVYLKLAKDFLKEKATAEEIDKLYKLMQELEIKQNKSSQIENVLVNIYSLLQYYEKAYKCYVKIAEKNNKKDRKKLFKLRQKYEWYGDRLAIKRKNEVTKSFMGKIPKFKYCPDTINTNILTVGAQKYVAAAVKLLMFIMKALFIVLKMLSVCVQNVLLMVQLLKNLMGNFNKIYLMMKM